MNAGTSAAGSRPALKRRALYGVAAGAGLATSVWFASQGGPFAPAASTGPPSGAPSAAPSTHLNLHRQARALPPLRFADGSGEAASLADFRGRVLLLNVWATWCTPCREEMPALDRLQAKLGGPDFRVVALSIDPEGSVVRDFFREVGIQHLQPYMDAYRETAAAVGLTVVPLTLLIDREGREIARKLGAAAWDHPTLVEQIQAQLAKATDVAPATAASPSPDLLVEGAWARSTMPGQDVSAVYLTLTSAVDAQIVEVRSEAAETVQVHEMTVENDIMRMRERKGVPLPAGRAVRLQPGGTHLMLQQLKKPLAPGDQIALSLTWLGAGGRERVTRIGVPVRTASPAGN